MVQMVPSIYVIVKTVILQTLLSFKMIRTFRTAYFKKLIAFAKMKMILSVIYPIWFLANGTLGAYVCWPTTFADGANECRKIARLYFVFREVALVAFVIFILVLSAQTIACAPCREKYECTKCASCLEKCKPTKSTETETLLTNDNSL